MRLSVHRLSFPQIGSLLITVILISSAWDVWYTVLLPRGGESNPNGTIQDCVRDRFVDRYKETTTISEEQGLIFTRTCTRSSDE